MDKPPKDTHSNSYFLDNEESKEQQHSLPRYPWSSPNHYAVHATPSSPLVNDLDASLSLDNSLNSDSTASTQSDQSPSNHINVSISAPIVFSSTIDPLPFILSSSPARPLPNRNRRTRALPYPLQRRGSPVPVRNALVRSYAIVESPLASLVPRNSSTLPSRSPKKMLGLKRDKSIPYNKENPMRQWKPHVRFKKEMIKVETKVATRPVVALDTDRTQELEMMFREIRLADEERQASPTAIFIPPIVQIGEYSSLAFDSSTSFENQQPLAGLRHLTGIEPGSEEEMMLLDDFY